MTKDKDTLNEVGMHDGAPPSVFRNAGQLRKKMTESESKLWAFLKEQPFGYKFRRQHPIHIYVLDFYCHKLKISIEVDGGYHNSKEQIVKDLKRSRYLESMTITEFRFTNAEVLNDFEDLKNKLKDIINDFSLNG
jgi:very-short-patch-repair endonuclease